MINLCEDKLNKVELHLPEKWKKVKTLHILDEEAVWHEIPFEKAVDGIALLTDFACCEPVYVKMS